jgi:hypothetical protein
LLNNHLINFAPFNQTETAAMARATCDRPVNVYSGTGVMLQKAKDCIPIGQNNSMAGIKAHRMGTKEVARE